MKQYPFDRNRPDQGPSTERRTVHKMRNIFFTLLLMLLAVRGSAADTDPVSVLQSNASMEAKIEACRLIAASGDESAIPVLEPLLNDSALSHMARYALEPMTGEAADQALLRALEKASGTVKAGIIASLGVRKTESAFDALAAAVDDPDNAVAEAAVRALGRLGTAAAVGVLETFSLRNDLPVALREATGEAFMDTAEAFLARDREDHASGFYEYVYFKKSFPVHVRAAALRGAVRAHETDAGWKLLVKAFQSDESALFEMALRIALEITPRARTAAKLAALLPEYSPERKLLVIQTLGELGVTKAGHALIPEAMAGRNDLRIAALNALTRLKYEAALPLITSLAVSADEELAPAARDCLAFFPGEAGDQILERLLKSEDSDTRLAAVGMIALGGLPDASNRLLNIARRDSAMPVRLAALEGAARHGGIGHLSEFMRHLTRPQSKEERTAAEDALRSIITRSRDKGIPDGIVKDLINTLNRAAAPQQPALITILTATGSQRAFDNLFEKTGADDEALRDAAVKAITDWPTLIALPTLLDWVSSNTAQRTAAFRGAARLLAAKQLGSEEALTHYRQLLTLVQNTDEKKLLLSGMGNLDSPDALLLVLDLLSDDQVKAEAVQAAMAIVRRLGETPGSEAIKEKAYALIPELKKD